MKLKSILFSASLILGSSLHGAEATTTKSAGSKANQKVAHKSKAKPRKRLTHSLLKNIPLEYQEKYFHEADQNFVFPSYKDNKRDTWKHAGTKSLEVPDGSVALITKKGEFLFKRGPWVNLEPIHHDYSKENTRINDSSYRRKTIVQTNQKLIEHGTWTIVRVHQGELGYMMNQETGQPMFLLPGTHKFNSPTKKFIEFLNFKENKIPAGNCTFAQVSQGQRGVVNDVHGNIRILEPGLHLLVEPDTYKTTISTKQEYVNLTEKRTDRKWYHVTYNTKDHVSLIIPAQLFYIIKDPQLAFSTGFGSEADLRTTLTNQSISMLSEIIRGNSLSDVGHKKSKDGSEQGELQNHDYQKFSNETIREFVKQFQAEFGDKYGIQIESLKMSSFSYANAKMQAQITGQAVANAETEAKLAALENQTRIKKEEAEANEEVRMIEVLADKREAEARAQQRLIDAKSLAAESDTQAQARANAIKLEGQAKAEAKAAIMIEQAKAMEAYIAIMNATPLGRDIARAQAVGEALSKCKLLVLKEIPNVFDPQTLLNLGSGSKEEPATESGE